MTNPPSPPPACLVRHPAVAVGAQAAGALALGALAVGALAIGALAIGRLMIGRARIGRLEIDELVVRDLRITGSCETTPKREGATDKKRRTPTVSFRQSDPIIRSFG